MFFLFPLSKHGSIHLCVVYFLLYFVVISLLVISSCILYFAVHSKQSNSIKADDPSLLSDSGSQRWTSAQVFAPSINQPPSRLQHTYIHTGLLQITPQNPPVQSIFFVILYCLVYLLLFSCINLFICFVKRFVAI